jgi:hypothetical protein
VHDGALEESVRRGTGRGVPRPAHAPFAGSGPRKKGETLCTHAHTAAGLPAAKTEGGHSADGSAVDGSKAGRTDGRAGPCGQ